MSSSRSAIAVGVVDALDVGAARGADPPPLVGRRRRGARRTSAQRLLRRADERHLDAEAPPRCAGRPPRAGTSRRRACRAPSPRSRTGRTSPRSAGRRRCPRPRSARRASSCGRPSTSASSASRPARGRDHVLGALAPPARGRVQDHRPLVARRRPLRVLREVDPGRDDLGLRHPADRVVGADDLRAGAAAYASSAASCRGCRSRGSGRPTSCPVARRIGNWSDFGTSVSPK